MNDSGRLVYRVHDLDSFLAFIRALIADCEDSVAKEQICPTPYFPAVPQANGWYNATIESFLEAAAACLEAKKHQEEWREASWRTFANFLYCGKIYE